MYTRLTLAFAKDYAFLITALIDLYEATGSLEWLEWSIELQNVMDTHFYDDKNGGYFNTDGSDKSILVRMKEDNDMAEPSENSYAVRNLVRLYYITENDDYKNRALETATYFT